MSVSNWVLNKYGVLCVDDIVTTSAGDIGIITDKVGDNQYIIKNVSGDIGLDSNNDIRLSTNEEVNKSLVTLLKSYP